MNENNDLFPFPPGPESEKTTESSLPAFPGGVEPEFSEEERRALRKMLQEFSGEKGEKAVEAGTREYGRYYTHKQPPTSPNIYSTGLSALNNI